MTMFPLWISFSCFYKHLLWKWHGFITSTIYNSFIVLEQFSLRQYFPYEYNFHLFKSTLYALSAVDYIPNSTFNIRANLAYMLSSLVNLLYSNIDVINICDLTFSISLTVNCFFFGAFLSLKSNSPKECGP